MAWCRDWRVVLFCRSPVTVITWCGVACTFPWSWVRAPTGVVGTFPVMRAVSYRLVDLDGLFDYQLGQDTLFPFGLRPSCIPNATFAYISPLIRQEAPQGRRGRVAPHERVTERRPNQHSKPGRQAR